MRLISPHVMYGIETEVLQRWKPSVVKVLGAHRILIDNMPHLDPNTKYILRIWAHNGWRSDGLGDFRSANPAPAQAAERWVSLMQNQFLNELSPHASDHWIGIEGFNEQGLDRWHADFSIEVARRLHNRYGIHFVALNPSVGTYNESDKWQDVIASGLPAVLIETDGRIGVHGYASWIMRSWHGDEYQREALIALRQNPDPESLDFDHVLQQETNPQTWTAFGVMNARRYMLQAGFNDVRFVLTEFGIDNVGDPAGFGRAFHGWKHWAREGTWEGWKNEGETDSQFYARQLVWSEKQLAELGYVDGATVFTYDDHPDSVGWRDFFFKGEALDFYLTLSEAVEPIPEPEPEPELDPLDELLNGLIETLESLISVLLLYRDGR